jgi:ZIP family zinc transporter
VFLFGARRWLRVRERQWSRMADIGVRRSVLVFAVLFVHSLPEGFALGTAWASDQDGLGFFVFLAIALQNIPEGTSVSIPMEAAGFGRAEQFWAAVATSLPQPVGAVVAFLLVDFAQALLPFSLAFAAGAMLALVGIELLPQAVTARRYLAVAAGAGLGGMTMLAVAGLLGV